MHLRTRVQTLRSVLRQHIARHQLHAATSPHRLPALGGGLVVTAAVAPTTGGITTWLGANALPLGIALVGVVLLFNARKKDHSATVQIVAGVIVAVMVFALSFGTTAQQVGTWAVSLFGVTPS
ncbi:hypothetical protein QMK19_35315 [Streptomyces sp. H10-C2]|uniref:hypothetical protein n=1 Tax=unclassified Streptomyces TaxID=2593676 RepID=UPI0024B9EA3B|nr:MULTISPECIES: hypothetical protein [unclassified Streptomyces]MDJ0345905.1 hypothetical protein [Streptomyces sp. PH10-H1]MDJ0374754.1 hypothetical protein [Streptomyces sp. H10-C2]